MTNNKDNKKYAIVTGVASGIGMEVAEQLHRNNVIVYGLDINKADRAYKTFVCDVSDEQQIIKIVEMIKEETMSLNYLVNVAGMLTIGQPVMLQELPIKQWDALMRINLRSVLIMLKSTHSLLKNADLPSVVNISSEQSIYPEIGFAPYAVSKAAINMLTMCAAQEFMKDNIRVNSLALGTVKTHILNSFCNSTNEQEEMYKAKNSSIPFGVMETNNVSDLVMFLLSDKSKYITGETIRADGGAYLG